MRSAYLPTDLAMIINSHSMNKRLIKIQCMISEEKFEHILGSSKFLQKFVQLKNVKNYEDYSHGICKINHEYFHDDVFHFIQYHDELYLISTDGARVFDFVLKFSRIIYPHVETAFVHSDGIYKILDNFEKIKNLDLWVKKTVRKQIFGEEPRTEISYETAKENREYPGFKVAYELARDNDLWIDRLKVFGKNVESKIKYQFSISRRGEVSIENGTFDSYFSTVLVPIIEYSKERKMKFQKRSRSEQVDKKPKPLIIKFGKDVFEEDEIRSDFVKLLEKYPHCNYSVVHNGNPHVYLSVLDRIDNSSFAVRTLGNNSLLLIPQIRTSALALMRFSEYLVTSFYEGVIQDYGQK